MKLVISNDDIFYRHARNEKETVDLFGQDYFDEYAVDIPDELAEQFLAAQNEFRKAQINLLNYLKKEGKL